MKSNRTGRRRGNREGSIYRRQDGRWAATISLGWQDGKNRRTTFYGSTRQEVAGKLAAGLRDRDLGLPGLPERQTVAQYLDQWLASPSMRRQEVMHRFGT